MAKLLKKGDVVSRYSYKNDILFKIDNIVKDNNGRSIAILKGLTIRIEADSFLEDLKKEKKEEIETYKKRFEKNTAKIIVKNRIVSNVINGKILHLDGDKRYSIKSSKYYKSLSINAIVKFLPEKNQKLYVRGLIRKYRPNILVITGHDAILKGAQNFNDIRSYRNSKFFMDAVTEARKEVRSVDELAIFAGACQSFFEGLISSGANFASSPNRILIDFIDPLIIASKIAMTEKSNYITMRDLEKILASEKGGIGGRYARGQQTKI